ncbi:MAG: hypothetical protein ABIH50_04830 [bacterium]
MGGRISNIYHRVAQRVCHPLRKPASNPVKPSLSLTTVNPAQPIQASLLSSIASVSARDIIGKIKTSVSAFRFPTVTGESETTSHNVRSLMYGAAALGSILCLSACGSVPEASALISTASSAAAELGTEKMAEFIDLVAKHITEFGLALAGTAFVCKGITKKFAPFGCNAYNKVDSFWAFAMVLPIIISTGYFSAIVNGYTSHLSLNPLAQGTIEISRYLAGAIETIGVALDDFANIYQKVKDNILFVTWPLIAAGIHEGAYQLATKVFDKSLPDHPYFFPYSPNTPSFVSRAEEKFYSFLRTFNHYRRHIWLGGVFANQSMAFAVTHAVHPSTVFSGLGVTLFLRHLLNREQSFQPYTYFTRPLKLFATYSIFAYSWVVYALCYYTWNIESDAGLALNKLSTDTTAFLLDASIGYLAVDTFKEMRAAVASRTHRTEYGSKSDLQNEAITRKAEAFSFRAMFVYLTSMLPGIVTALPSVDLISSQPGVAAGKVLGVGLTTWFVGKYWLSNLHNLFQADGSAENVHRSVSAPQSPLADDTFIELFSRDGIPIAGFNPSKGPTPTNIGIVYKLLLNPYTFVQSLSCYESHAANTLGGAQELRAALAYFAKCNEIGKGIFGNFHQVYLNLLNNQVDEQATMAQLADTLTALGEKYCDEKMADSYIAMVRKWREEDKARQTNNIHYFDAELPIPYLDELNQALRIRGLTFLATADNIRQNLAKGNVADRAELLKDLLYYMQSFDVPVEINARHMVFQDDRLYNKIVNLANAHTYHGDTIYEVWLVNNEDLINPQFQYNMIPSRWIRIKNPYYTYNDAKETDPAKKHKYIWIDRSYFEHELKYSQSWSDIIKDVDNTPLHGELGGEFVEGFHLPWRHGTDTVRIFATSSEAPLPAKRLTLREGQEHALDSFHTCFCGQATPPSEEFKNSFRAWAKDFGLKSHKFKHQEKEKTVTYDQWLATVAAEEKKDPKDLFWIKEKPGMICFLGKTSGADSGVDTIDEEHVPVNYKLAAKVVFDRVYNRTVTVTYNHTIKRRLKIPAGAASLGTPTTMQHVQAKFLLKVKLDMDKVQAQPWYSSLDDKQKASINEDIIVPLDMNHLRIPGDGNPLGVPAWKNVIGIEVREFNNRNYMYVKYRANDLSSKEVIEDAEVKVLELPYLPHLPNPDLIEKIEVDSFPKITGLEYFMRFGYELPKDVPLFVAERFIHIPLRWFSADWLPPEWLTIPNLARNLLSPQKDHLMDLWLNLIPDDGIRQVEGGKYYEIENYYPTTVGYPIAPGWLPEHDLQVLREEYAHTGFATGRQIYTEEIPGTPFYYWSPIKGQLEETQPATSKTPVNRVQKTKRNLLCKDTGLACAQLMQKDTDDGLLKPVPSEIPPVIPFTPPRDWVRQVLMDPQNARYVVEIRFNYKGKLEIISGRKYKRDRTGPKKHRYHLDRFASLGHYAANANVAWDTDYIKSGYVDDITIEEGTIDQKGQPKNPSFFKRFWQAISGRKEYRVKIHYTKPGKEGEFYVPGHIFHDANKNPLLNSFKEKVSSLADIYQRDPGEYGPATKMARPRLVSYKGQIQLELTPVDRQVMRAPQKLQAVKKWADDNNLILAGFQFAAPTSAMEVNGKYWVPLTLTKPIRFLNNMSPVKTDSYYLKTEAVPNQETPALTELKKHLDANRRTLKRAALVPVINAEGKEEINVRFNIGQTTHQLPASYFRNKERKQPLDARDHKLDWCRDELKNPGTDNKYQNWDIYLRRSKTGVPILWVRPKDKVEVKD